MNLLIITKFVFLNIKKKKEGYVQECPVLLRCLHRSLVTLTVKMNGTLGWCWSDGERGHLLTGTSIFYLLHIVTKMCLFIYSIYTSFIKHLMCWALCFRAAEKTAGPWGPHWPGGDRYSLPFHKTTWCNCYNGDARQGLWNKLDQLYQGGGRGGQERSQKARKWDEVCPGVVVMGVAHCRVQSSACSGRSALPDLPMLLGPRAWLWPVSGEQRCTEPRVLSCQLKTLQWALLPLAWRAAISETVAVPKNVSNFPQDTPLDRQEMEGKKTIFPPSILGSLAGAL